MFDKVLNKPIPRTYIKKVDAYWDLCKDVLVNSDDDFE